MADSGVSFSIDVGVQAAGADSAAASLDSLTDKIVGAGTSAPAAVKSLEEIGDAAKDAGESGGLADFRFKKLSGSLGGLGGPLGAAGQKVTAFADDVQDMTEILGGGGAALAIFPVLIAAATAALVAGSAALFAWSVNASDAARSSALLSDGIAGSVQGGRDLDATIHALGSKVPQTREELLAMAGDLRKSGLSGDALSAALEDTATKAAKLKWGPDFVKQTLALPNQIARLKANFTGLFSGLKIDALLEGLAEIVKLFDANEASGKAVKVVFESLFQPLTDGLTSIIPKIIGWVLQVEIWFLKAAIAVKPFTNEILEAGKFVAFTGALIAGVLAGGLGIVLVNVIAVAQQVGFLINAFERVVAYLRATDLSTIGSDMITGLANGITGAAGKVLSAMTGAVGGAIDGAKNLLGIHSPSKVFAEIGTQTGAGMAQGVEASTGGVQSALEGMVSTPTAPSATPSGMARGGASVTGNTFVFNGVAGVEDAEASFGALLTRLLEGDAAQIGGAVPA